MRMQIVSCFTGVGKASKKPFCRVGAMLFTPNGNQYCEFFFDVEHAAPVVGKTYDVGVEAYAARDKSLVIRVAQLREVPAVAPAKAA